MVSKHVQSIVDSIAEECRRRFHGQAVIIWFGSWMKDTAYQQSEMTAAFNSGNTNTILRLA